MEPQGLTEFLSSAANIWLLAGILLILVDALHLGGIGLLFAGLGAVAVGAGMHLGWVASEAYVTQFLLFFAATAASAFLLWKPIKRFRINPDTMAMTPASKIAPAILLTSIPPDIVFLITPSEFEPL